MASRKDQLNAYTFARKRTVAAFLQPTPSGSEEGAPRPARAVMPSIVVGALILVGFGAWGIIKPTAPPGWDKPGEYIIVGSDSTTRYVVLQDEDENGKKGDKLLHPVLNLASAKLLLDQGKGQVIKVKESELDSGRVQKGATIGIPYAPDRLPSPQDAGKAKKWAMCERPNAGGGKVADKAVFVLGGRDSGRVEGAQRLSGAQTLYVQGPDHATYLVDPRGTRYPLVGDEPDLLRRALFGSAAQPQQVTRDWLASLNRGSSVFFPTVPGLGEISTVGGLDDAHNTVGMVLTAESNGEREKYVVLRDRVERVSDFTAQLLLKSEAALEVYRGTTPKALEVPLPSVVGTSATPYLASMHWPDAVPIPVNTAQARGGQRTVACSVYRGEVSMQGKPNLSVWAGTDYPIKLAEGTTSAYVTPGTGLFYREISGTPGSGALYLVTDTGLRYSVSNDNDAGKAVTGRNSKDEQGAGQQQNQAQIRLGYDKVDPVPVVPQTWSGFLSKGPTLNTKGAAQPQGS